MVDMKKFMFVLFALIMLLSSCGGKPTATVKPKDNTIWFVLMNSQHPVNHLMRLGFSDACADLKLTCKYYTYEGADPARYIQAIEEVKAQGGYGIVTLIGLQSQWGVIDEMTQSGMKIVAVHVPFVGADKPNIAAWVSTDPLDYARRSAQAMGEKLNGKGTVAITMGSINDTESPVAAEFTSYMKSNFPDIIVLSPEEEGFDEPAAIAKASAIIQAHPELNGAFSTTGGGSTTWAKAAQETGHNPGDITIIAMDYTMPNLDLMKQRWIYRLVGQPLYEEEYLAVELLQTTLVGGKISFDNWLPAPLISPENMSQWIGYNTQAESRFGVTPVPATTP
jgi:ribose transport system substrate-binding protein